MNRSAPILRIHRRLYLAAILAAFFVNHSWAAEQPTASSIPTAPAPGTSVESSAPPLPPKTFLELPNGKARFNSVIQSWAVGDSNASSAYYNFRIRRAEIRFSGTFRDDLRWFVMINPAKSLSTGPISAANDNKILQDAGVGARFGQDFELILGQMKILTTAESLEPSSGLLFPERSLVARIYGDMRQTGVQLQFKSGDWTSGLMLSNGGRANTDDVTTPKDLSARVDYSPFKNLTLGAFLSAEDTRIADFGKWGLNARWAGERESLQFDLVQGDDSSTGVKISSSGVVVDAAYRIGTLQPAFRFERYTANVNADVSVRAILVGMNWYILSNQYKLQAEFGWLTNANANNGSYVPALPASGSAEVTSNLVVIAAQAAI